MRKNPGVSGLLQYALFDRGTETRYRNMICDLPPMEVRPFQCFPGRAICPVPSIRGTILVRFQHTYAERRPEQAAARAAS